MRGSIAPQEESEPRCMRVKTEFGMSLAGTPIFARRASIAASFAFLWRHRDACSLAQP